MAKETFNLQVNGCQQAVSARGDTPLTYLLRNHLGLKGTRFGCGTGDCGACMVLIDGAAEMSCQSPVESIAGKTVDTVEGLVGEEAMSVLLQAILEEQAGQCGYCMSGIIVTATALLRACSEPSEAEIRQALDGHLCRCGSHARIIAAIQRAAKMGVAA